MCVGCDEQSEETSTGHRRRGRPSHSVSQGHTFTQHMHTVTHTDIQQVLLDLLCANQPSLNMYVIKMYWNVRNTLSI